MERYSDEVALLVAESGPLIGQRWALHNTISLGREASCDIMIPDRQVSRHHAQFTHTFEGTLLEDLNSKNGTHLNGKPLKGSALLKDGDVIQVALAQKFVFYSSDATVPLEVSPDGQKILSFHPSIEQPAALNPVDVPTQSTIPGRLILEKRSRRVWIRAKQAGTISTSAQLDSEYNEVEIDPPLSASQFRLLELLYESQGRVVTRHELVVEVWGTEQAIGVSEQAFDALVRRLRDRLASVDSTYPFIVTVRGHGLRLDNPPL